MTELLTCMNTIEIARVAACKAAISRPGQRLINREGRLWRWEGFTAVWLAPFTQYLLTKAASGCGVANTTAGA